MRGEAYPAWFRDWVEIEREATSLRWFEPQIDRLIVAASQPRVVFLVVPSDAGAHPGLAGHFVIAGFDGRPDVAYLDNALAGQVVERAADVARIVLLYDILKAEALAPRASVDLARKAIERWT
ncbi:MAG TPA: Scr1 family TA system antitoxin-like transcriptional regulator [Streptosporangiaceae bacterium]|nr:Scr1 family TA system antitoxin-like transcriptional regulator [Streptosporangiaceae bacterium]